MASDLRSRVDGLCANLCAYIHMYIYIYISAVVKIMFPFLDALNIRCRTLIGILKRGHNFDNHPYMHRFTRLVRIFLMR